ncbi:MAG: hypothetical protein HC785_29380 [Calothrix sp. CSU_2_0]|nr:hypothetical protein [Calothrix sp. CSU_2_0]
MVELFPFVFSHSGNWSELGLVRAELPAELLRSHTTTLREPLRGTWKQATRSVSLWDSVTPTEYREYRIALPKSFALT